ncbi:MAG: oligopeptide transporter, OPT family [Planctomycetes bacterium RBG_16_59_8]|nr:MAG: oligopeptide transporter, OPT family [Planctomycetes bacterium RBG_16_59_8]
MNKELTIRAVVLGCLLAVVFGAANAYLGLKVGMTVSASIPAAVISMAILRTFCRNATILENNMVQTIASSGESLAAGVIFTIPALILIGAPPSMLMIFMISLVGGCLGIFFMIPLRRHLIVREHGALPFPEGTACAEVLKAGASGGGRALLVAWGLIAGGLYKFLMSGMKLWKGEDILWSFPRLHKASIGIEPTPALLAVGYIVGLRIASVMFVGGVVGWLVLIPIIDASLAGSGSLSAGKIWSDYIRYIGAGAVALGGFVSLARAFPTIVGTLREGFGGKGKRIEGTGSADPRNRDLPMGVVVIGSTITALVIFLLLQFSTGQWLLNLIASLIIIIFGFFFVAVAARIVGIVGSSSSPVSGMTITTILFTSLLLLWLGFSGQAGMIVALTVGAIVCIAVCMAGDISQDLKTGYLVGSSPFNQQIGEFFGVAIPALVIGGTLFLLQETYGFGAEPGNLPAPQATLMSMVVKGVMAGSMPWGLVILGMAIALVVELMRIPSLPFAIGLYLPIGLSVPIMIGGLVAWVTNRTTNDDIRKERQDRGILLSSGLVAGDALMGIVIALLAYLGWNLACPTIAGAAPDEISTGIFLLLAGAFLMVIVRKKKPETE